MTPASYARDRAEVRLLVVDTVTGRVEDGLPEELARRLSPGDLVVLNDAATLPSSLAARLPEVPERFELRLASQSDRGFWAVAFGAGDWRQRTEDRPPPPSLTAGARVELGAGLSAEVVQVSPRSPRLVELVFSCSGEALLAALYAAGRPVQYAYHRAPLELWSVQTAYGGAPLAFEMPSAGRPLGLGVLLALRARGVKLATLTHAAGLSSTGDVDLDAQLPLPERYVIPEATVQEVLAAKARGARIVAVGTTVVRALEGAARDGLRAGAGETDLVVKPGFRPRVVTDLLTGMHVPGESHHELMRAFVPEAVLIEAQAHAERWGYLSHEFGDLAVFLGRRPGLRRGAITSRETSLGAGG